MIIKTILSTALVLGFLSTNVNALDLPQITLANGEVYEIVPLPSRRGKGGSVHAIVSKAAARHGVPQRLAHAVIGLESRHNCSARSRSGASGLGQLMPGTARAMGVRDSMNCHQNANGAMKYLGDFYRRTGGNWCAAATAYNRGSVGGCSGYGRKVVHSAGRSDG